MYKYKVSRNFTLSLLIFSSILFGCSQEKQQRTTPMVTYTTVKSTSVTLTTELSGRTSAFFVAEVRPQVGGIIQKRLFEEGSDVEEGDVLYQIDPSLYQASYANAKAAVLRAEASANAARLLVKRYAELVKVKAVSRQDYDNAVADHESKKADVVAAKAALETAKINLDYTSVTAPVSGRIGLSSVTQGALVTQNQSTPLSTIQQLDQMYVDLTQSSKDMLNFRKSLAEGKLKRGGQNATQVRLLLEDGSLYPEMGKLQFSDVTVDQSTGTVTIRAVFPNEARILMPGMYVRAIIEEGINDNAILISQKIPQRDSRGQLIVKVLISDPENPGLYKTEQRTVVASRAINGDQWLISSGLNAGDLLLVDGWQAARQGQLVQGTSIDPVVVNQNPE